MKNILLFLSFVIILCIVLLVSVPFWVDVNQYRPQIAQVIKEKTGVGVTINGKITARAFPDIALMLEDVAVASAFEGEANVFHAKKMMLDVQLRPLLQKRLEVDSFKLVEPEIQLHVKKDGKANWDIVKVEQPQAQKVAEDGATEVALDTKAQEEFSLQNNFRLKSLVVSDGVLRYQDETSGKDITLTKWNVDMSVLPGKNNFAISGNVHNVFPTEGKGKLALKGNYSIEGHKYTVDNAEVTLDEIVGYITLALDMHDAKNIGVNASLYVNDLVLDPYLAKAPAEGGKTEGGSAAKESAATGGDFAWSHEKLDISLPKNIDAQFNFKAASIAYEDLKTGEVMATMQLRDGRLTTDVKDTKVYDGTINAQVVLDGAAVVPAFKTNLAFQNLNLNELPGKYRKADKIKGVASGQWNLYSSGGSQAEMVQRLNGKGNLNLKDGRIRGVDFFSMVKNISSAFTPDNASHETRFEDVSADFDIQQGIVSNNNLVLKSDVVNFAGSGTVNLPELTIDYRLVPQYSQDFAAEDKKGPQVPIAITGSLLHPTYRLEVKTIIKDIIQNPEGTQNLINQFKRDFKGLKDMFH